MKWLKRYAIGFIITTFVLAGMQAYRHPGKEEQGLGAAVLLGAVWPIAAAVMLGGCVGELASDGWDAEITAARLEKRNATSHAN